MNEQTNETTNGSSHENPNKVKKNYKESIHRTFLIYPALVKKEISLVIICYNQEKFEYKKFKYSSNYIFQSNVHSY